MHEHASNLLFARFPKLASALALSFLLCGSAQSYAAMPAQAGQSRTAAAQATSPGVPFSPDKLASLLPATVYFQGRTAPVQLRNAGGTSFGEGRILWAALVDTSGYSTAVQDKYQFYFVTESPVRLGDKLIPAGAYGGGFLADRFVIQDLGGHTVAEGPLQDDASLRRPRPLQVVADSPDSVKLYLGRRWVAIKAASDRTE
jgi:hypothetical protein